MPKIKVILEDISDMQAAIVEHEWSKLPGAKVTVVREPEPNGHHVMTPEQVAAANEMFRKMPEGVREHDRITAGGDIIDGDMFDPGPAVGALDGEFDDDEALTDIYFRMRADMNRIYDRAMGLEERLKAEGAHTEAANAEIGRLRALLDGKTQST